MCISGGYILQPRKIDDSELMHEAPVVRELWLYLLRNVNHKDNGKFKRGTGFFNLDAIAEDLHWTVGYRKMKYSKPQLSKALRRQCERNMSATMKATRGIIVTILNYDYYQDPKNYEGNDEKLTKDNTKVYTKNKNDKNEEEGKEIKEIKEGDVYISRDHLSITWGEMNKLIDLYGDTVASDTITNILNYRKNVKYKSLYLTAIKWIQKDIKAKEEKIEQNKKQPKLSI